MTGLNISREVLHLPKKIIIKSWFLNDVLISHEIYYFEKCVTSSSDGGTSFDNQLLEEKKNGNYSISHIPNLGNLLVKNNINDGQIVTFYNIKMVVGVNFFYYNFLQIKLTIQIGEINCAWSTSQLLNLYLLSG
jgi:hypothetical protein